MRPMFMSVALQTTFRVVFRVLKTYTCSCRKANTSSACDSLVKFGRTAFLAHFFYLKLKIAATLCSMRSPTEVWKWFFFGKPSNHRPFRTLLIEYLTVLVELLGLVDLWLVPLDFFVGYRFANNPKTIQTVNDQPSDQKYIKPFNLVNTICNSH